MRISMPVVILVLSIVLAFFLAVLISACFDRIAVIGVALAERNELWVEVFDKAL